MTGQRAPDAGGMRLHSLDALRGICAVIVVLHHLALVSPGMIEWIDRLLLPMPLVAGQSAVSIFFVLSGFVLFLTFTEKDNGQVAPFIVKRLGRLYPPVVASVGLSLVLLIFVQPTPVAELSPWFARFWAGPVDPGQIARHVLLADGTLRYNPPLWSLAVELRFSLLFPLLAIVLLKWRRAGLIACVVAGIVLRVIAARMPAGMVFNPIFTLQYLPAFAIGAAMVLDRDKLAAFVARLNGQTRWSLLIASIVLVTVPPTRLGGIPTLAGASVLTALVAFDRRISQALNTGPLLFFGRISFSLYLVHFPIVFAMTHAFHGIVPLALILATAFAVSVGVATVFFVLVERPSMHFGRMLAARMAPRAAVVATG